MTAVEKQNAHANFIAKVAKELKTDALRLIRGDVFRYLHSAPRQGFDFIFADPPYALPELPDVPRIILEQDLLREGGLFIMEHSKANDFSHLPYFYQHRTYGAVNFSLFLKETTTTERTRKMVYITQMAAFEDTDNTPPHTIGIHLATTGLTHLNRVMPKLRQLSHHITQVGKMTMMTIVGKKIM